MKKFLALLLSVSFLLSGCMQVRAGGESGEAEPTGNAEGAKLLSQYALAEAALPQLPAEPSEAELMAAYEKLDYEKMGSEAYQKAQTELWADFDERSRAYYNAVRALRGDGVDAAAVPALTDYSVKTAAALLSDTDGENVVYSPANLYLALSMLSETTDGGTRAQLLDLLGAENEETVRTTADALWRSLYADSASGKTLLANSLWLRDGQEYREDTLRLLAERYYASVYSVPMGAEDANRAVRAWLNDNTGGLLSDAAEGVKTTPETVLLLLSALYFKDQWSDPFFAGNTYEDVFFSADGGQRTQFMHKTQDHAQYVREKSCTIAQLRFRGGESMAFLLPDEDVTLSSLLGDETLMRGFLSGMNEREDTQSAKLLWSVPKLDVSSDLELTSALKALGISDVFDANSADFSPLADFALPTAVSQVQHAARVTLDEEGCEAAAFTAIAVAETALPPQDLPTVEMNLNRPFAFLITGADGLPLFLGAVNTVK